jgi:hypothetical protein
MKMIWLTLIFGMAPAWRKKKKKKEKTSKFGIVKITIEIFRYDGQGQM